MNLQVDLSYLNEISDGDSEFVASILTTFLEECPKDLSGMKKGLDNGDLVSVGKLAHKNKSTLQLFGLLGLKQLAFDIEQTAKKDATHPSIAPNAKVFIEYMEKLIPQVIDIINVASKLTACQGIYSSV